MKFRRNRFADVDVLEPRVMLAAGDPASEDTTASRDKERPDDSSSASKAGSNAKNSTNSDQGKPDSGRETATNSRETTTNSRETTTNSRETTTNSRETTTNSRETTTNSRETATNSRETATNSRETATNSPSTAANSPSTAANSRDTTANSRDTTANSRDTTANSRETTTNSRGTAANSPSAANSRDTAANSPGTAANSRDTTANSRGTAASSPSAAANSRGAANSASLSASSSDPDAASNGLGASSVARDGNSGAGAVRGGAGENSAERRSVNEERLQESQQKVVDSVYDSSRTEEETSDLQRRLTGAYVGNSDIATDSSEYRSVFDGVGESLQGSGPNSFRLARSAGQSMGAEGGVNVAGLGSVELNARAEGTEAAGSGLARNADLASSEVANLAGVESMPVEEGVLEDSSGPVEARPSGAGLNAGDEWFANTAGPVQRADGAMEDPQLEFVSDGRAESGLAGDADWASSEVANLADGESMPVVEGVLEDSSGPVEARPSGAGLNAGDEWFADTAGPVLRADGAMEDPQLEFVSDGRAESGLAGDADSASSEVANLAGMESMPIVEGVLDGGSEGAESRLAGEGVVNADSRESMENGSVGSGDVILPDNVNAGYSPESRTVFVNEQFVENATDEELTTTLREEVGEDFAANVQRASGVKAEGDVGDRLGAVFGGATAEEAIAGEKPGPIEAFAAVDGSLVQTQAQTAEDTPLPPPPPASTEPLQSIEDIRKVAWATDDPANPGTPDYSGNTPPVPPDGVGTWKLNTELSDEFSGGVDADGNPVRTDLDSSKWERQYWNHGNPTEMRVSDTDVPEFAQGGATPGDETLGVYDGNMFIKAVDNGRTPTGSTLTGEEAAGLSQGDLDNTVARWVSTARVASKGNLDLSQGDAYISARIKTSNISQYNTFWMQTDGGDINDRDEIDIIENNANPSNPENGNNFREEYERQMNSQIFQSRDGDTYRSADNRQRGDLSDGNPLKDKGWDDDYHTYGVHVTDGGNTFQFYLDGEAVGRRTLDPKTQKLVSPPDADGNRATGDAVEPFDDNMEIIMSQWSTALNWQGGLPRRGEDAPISDNDQNTMWVDWVRVYQLEKGASEGGSDSNEESTA